MRNHIYRLILTIAAFTGQAAAQDAGTPTLGDSGVAASAETKVASGPPPTAKVECSPNPVLIGQPLLCEVTVVHRDDVSIKVTGPDDIEPLAPSPAIQHGSDLLKSVRQLRVIPKSMKKVQLEGLTVVWTETDGAIGELTLDKQIIPVASVMTGLTDPRPRTYLEPNMQLEGDALTQAKSAFFNHHGPVAYRVTNWALIITLIVVFGGSLFIGLGVWLNRWLRSRQQEEEEWVDPRPAHIIAFESLAALKETRLPEQGLYEVYFVRISEILRAYLKKRFGINGLEMTSQEIADWARSEALAPEQQAAINDFLYATDIVKFANVKPDETEIDIVTRQAHGLIELTRDRTAEQTAASGEAATSRTGVAS